MGMNKWASACFKTHTWAWVHKVTLKVMILLLFKQPHSDTGVEWSGTLQGRTRDKNYITFYVSHRHAYTNWGESISDCNVSTFICRLTLSKKSQNWAQQYSWQKWTVSFKPCFYYLELSVPENTLQIKYIKTLFCFFCLLCSRTFGQKWFWLNSFNVEYESICHLHCGIELEQVCDSTYWRVEDENNVSLLTLSLSWNVHYFSFSEILGKGADLPRMKQVVPVNTVLQMDMVSICKKRNFNVFLVTGLTIVFIPNRDL